MSLWNKPISQITFEDIDASCKTMQPEGARLDYKGIAFPTTRPRPKLNVSRTLKTGRWNQRLVTIIVRA
jgi:hypothetical protein